MKKELCQTLVEPGEVTAKNSGHQFGSNPHPCTNDVHDSTNIVTQTRFNDETIVNSHIFLNPYAVAYLIAYFSTKASSDFKIEELSQAHYIAQG